MLFRLVDGRRVQLSAEEEAATLAEQQAAASRPAPVPDPTPLQLIEAIEADETVLSDGSTRIQKLMGLIDQLSLLKLASASYIRHDDPRIQQFKTPLELDDTGLVSLFRRAARR